MLSATRIVQHAIAKPSDDQYVKSSGAAGGWVRRRKQPCYLSQARIGRSKRGPSEQAVEMHREEREEAETDVSDSLDYVCVLGGSVNIHSVLENLPTIIVGVAVGQVDTVTLKVCVNHRSPYAYRTK